MNNSNSNDNDNINLINNNNFFSNTYPDLIGEKTFSDLNKLVIVENTSIKENKNLINSSFNLYKKYIQPNLLPIIIIIIFIVFMIYRYMTSKKDSDKKNKKNLLKKKII